MPTEVGMYQARVVKVGNSRGFRVPKALLEQAGIAESVTIEAVAGTLVIRPAAEHPRTGWADEARRMHENGDDAALWPADLEDAWASEW